MQRQPSRFRPVGEKNLKSKRSRYPVQPAQCRLSPPMLRHSALGGYFAGEVRRARGYLRLNRDFSGAVSLPRVQPSAAGP